MAWLQTVDRVDDESLEFDERVGEFDERVTEEGPAEGLEPEGPDSEGPGGRGLRAKWRRRAWRPEVRKAERLGRDTLLRRAAHLPELPRALITASVGLGMSSRELAAIHHVTPRVMRKRLAHWRAVLADPCFILMVQFGDQLPTGLATLARRHWVEDRALRGLAAERGQTLHRVRRELGMARTLLLLAMANRQGIPVALAEAALVGSGG